MKLEAKHLLLSVADDKSATQAFGYLEKAEDVMVRVEKIIVSAARVHSEQVLDNLKKQARELSDAIDNAMQHLDSNYDV